MHCARDHVKHARRGGTRCLEAVDIDIGRAADNCPFNDWRHDAIHRMIYGSVNKCAVDDKTGQTLPTTAIILAMDADRNIRHSRALASNINKANRGQCRPQETDAHHIVGRLDFRATDSRTFLFMWGIGINDADNGVYLPRYARTKIANMLKAHHHQGLHTDDYYFNVEIRLRTILG